MLSNSDAGAGISITITTMSASAKKSWNWPLGIGFLFALAGFFSYTFFAQFPITRDFPWANLLLFAAGGILLVLGLFRAFGKPRVYRGKILGPILAILGLLMFGFFSYVLLCAAAGPAFDRSAASRRKSSRVHLVESGWEGDLSS